MLDLILLKRDVYRHLLFNRGSGARLVADDVPDMAQNDDRDEVKGLKKFPGKDQEHVTVTLLSFFLGILSA